MEIEKLKNLKGKVARLFLTGNYNETLDSIKINEQKRELSGFNKQGNEVIVSFDIILGVIPVSVNTKK
jgi:hypothetical protein